MALYTPVPSECVHSVADHYKIPPAILFALIKTEGGLPGQGLRNRDGTVDWGPMQINSRWFVKRGSPVRQAFPDVSPQEIETSPCVNVEVGGWILARLHRHVSLWTAVAHYHSFNPALYRPYVRRVKWWYRQFVGALHPHRWVVRRRKHASPSVQQTQETDDRVIATAGEY